MVHSLDQARAEILVEEIKKAVSFGRTSQNTAANAKKQITSLRQASSVRAGYVLYPARQNSGSACRNRCSQTATAEASSVRYGSGISRRTSRQVSARLIAPSQRASSSAAW